MLTLHEIKKSYAKKKVLKGVDVEIKEGEFFVFLGSSGSGKSTLLKILSGIESLDSGCVLLNGEDITQRAPQQRKIGYIFQEPLLFPHMNAKENICYSLQIAKRNKDEINASYEKFEKLLQIEGLSHFMPNQLSGGQKQRVSLARSLINTPEILLMDEPFSSLDYTLRSEMGEMIKKLQKELSLTVIFVTHDIEESITLSDRIAFLHNGKILEKGFPQQMYYNPEFEQTARFMGEYNKISGTVKNGIFENKYCPISGINDSRKEIFVRPNKIRLMPHKNGEFLISNIIKTGKSDTIILENEPLKIESYFASDLKIGDRVAIEFAAF